MATVVERLRRMRGDLLLGDGVHDAVSVKDLLAALETPIDMVLYCPKCHLQHIDRDESPSDREWAAQPAGDRECQHWTNPPHRSHLCHGCGHVWRPADVATNGVAAVKTVGKHDSSVAVPLASPELQMDDAWLDKAARAAATVGSFYPEEHQVSAFQRGFANRVLVTFGPTYQSALSINYTGGEMAWLTKPPKAG